MKDLASARSARTWILAGTASLTACGVLLLLIWSDAFGQRVGDPVAVVFYVLAGSGLLCLVVAAFLGPGPFWSVSRSDVGDRPRSGVPLVLTVAIVVIYLGWSLPHLQPGAVDQPDYLLPLGIGAACAVAAVRAANVVLAVVLGTVAAFLLFNASAEASIIWLHGAGALLLLGLLVALFRTRKAWVGAASTIGLVVGVPLWLYAGFVVMFLTCGEGSGCLS